MASAITLRHQEGKKIFVQTFRKCSKNVGIDVTLDEIMSFTLKVSGIRDKRVTPLGVPSNFTFKNLPKSVQEELIEDLINNEHIEIPEQLRIRMITKHFKKCQEKTLKVSH